MRTLKPRFPGFSLAVLLLIASLMAACTVAPRTLSESRVIAAHAALEMNNAWAAQSMHSLHEADGGVASGWHHFKLPGKKPSEFEYARLDGRDAMRVRSHSAASMLRLPMHVASADLGNLRFSWHVPQLISQADLALREADDSPVRIVLAFEGDRAKFSAKNAMLNELTRAITGEEMPYATLMYVWSNERPVGTLIHNARTDRVRKLVVQSGPVQLNQWLEYERDIRADYEQAFGETPGALVGIAIMTDTDNTQSETKAWYGPLKFAPAVNTRTLLNK